MSVSFVSQSIPTVSQSVPSKVDFGAPQAQTSNNMDVKESSVTATARFKKSQKWDDIPSEVKNSDFFNVFKKNYKKLLKLQHEYNNPLFLYYIAVLPIYPCHTICLAAEILLLFFS